MARAIECGDEHAIKFTEVCLREYELNPRPEYLGIMAAWALLAGALAARFFRWDQA